MVPVWLLGFVGSFVGWIAGWLFGWLRLAKSSKPQTQECKDIKLNYWISKPAATKRFAHVIVVQLLVSVVDTPIVVPKYHVRKRICEHAHTLHYSALH